MEKASLENLKFLIFLAFYFFVYEKFVLLPNINFLSTKHNKILKFDPEVLNQSHSAIVLRLLLFFLDML